MKSTLTYGVLALALMACAVQPAVGVTVYNNESNFLIAAGPLAFEGFEGLPVNNSLYSSSIAAPGFVVTASNSGLGIYNTPISGQFATEGVKFLVHQSGANVTTTFAFGSPIKCFGFDLIDYGDWGTGQLTLVNDAGYSTMVAVSGGPDRNVRYWGMISDFAFSKAIFTNTISGEAFAFDKVSYGVPEPATLSLLVLAGSALLARRRR